MIHYEEIKERIDGEIRRCEGESLKLKNTKKNPLRKFWNGKINSLTYVLGLLKLLRTKQHILIHKTNEILAIKQRNNLLESMMNNVFGGVNKSHLNEPIVKHQLVNSESHRTGRTIQPYVIEKMRHNNQRSYKCYIVNIDGIMVISDWCHNKKKAVLQFEKAFYCYEMARNNPIDQSLLSAIKENSSLESKC